MPDSLDGPPPSVLAAFGARGPTTRLPGGFDGAWRVGDLVLKRSDATDAALEAELAALGSLSHAPLRVQQLRRALDGALRVEGWIARDYLPGNAAPDRWADVLAAGDALNAALRAVRAAAAQPMISARTDPWARADRMAWDEEPIPDERAFSAEPLPSLLAARTPVATGSQLVHGDLAGNVLFAEGMPPAVIDFSPYWRPAVWAQSIAVADCVMWFGAPLDLIRSIAARPEAGQCLVRAIIFRHVTGVLLGRSTPSGAAAERYRSLVAAAIALA